MTQIHVGILTVSDQSFRGERIDSSAPVLIQCVNQADWLVSQLAVVPNEIDLIIPVLKNWCDEECLDLILTSGGTGFSPRDITPEATLRVIDRHAPGLAEAMRAESLRITPHAMLSRGVTGIRKRTLIINLPGSPKGAIENLEIIMPILSHAIELIHEDPLTEVGY